MIALIDGNMIEGVIVLSLIASVILILIAVKS